jgi:hypothetical protein
MFSFFFVILHDFPALSLFFGEIILSLKNQKKNKTKIETKEPMK